MMKKPNKQSYDVVIIGGAMHGASVAWFLTHNPDFDGSVLVVEKDPTYEFAATSRTNSCMRQQYTCDINIKMSQFAAEYINNLQKYSGGEEETPHILIQNFGYMYLADNDDFAKNLRDAQNIQKKCGVPTQYMSPEQIKEEYPFYNVSDIVAGSLNTKNEGYFDGAGLFDWWRKSAKNNGAEYVHNEVVGMSLNNQKNQIEEVTLKSGEKIKCGVVVNATGIRSNITANMVGVRLPIEPKKRYTFVFDSKNPLEKDLPLTIDPTGIHFRTDGNMYCAGCDPYVDDTVEHDDFEEDHSLWEQKVWPVIAHRIPQFETIKLVRSWVCHYDFNVFDHNAIIGPHTKIANLMFACGFSGHGLQQSPATGRGIAEIITTKKYQTLDLTPFSFQRIEQNKPFVETAVI